MGETNGRRIMYAFDMITFGKTCSVPSVGAVSLSASQPWYVRNTVAFEPSSIQRSLHSARDHDARN